MKALGPHRLEAQDAALSRRQQGFKSPWGYTCVVNKWKRTEITAKTVVSVFAFTLISPHLAGLVLCLTLRLFWFAADRPGSVFRSHLLIVLIERRVHREQLRANNSMSSGC